MPTSALLFMGDLVVLARQARLISDAARRGLAPVAVVGLGTDLGRLDALRADATHPLSALAEVVQVPDASIATVLQAVQPLLRRYEVRGVVSVGEVFVEPVGVLADCLGLPGAGTTASVICRNKLLQRTTVPEFSPEYEAVPADRRATFTVEAGRFPLVVKPAGRYYSSGVRLVTDQAELTAALTALGDDEIALVESRVVGPEFSVEAIVQGGVVLWSGVTGKESNEHETSYFTELAHTSPAVLDPDDHHALVAANTEIIRRVGLRDGITHAEYRLSSAGPVLMEIAARLPGDAITFLWELATGQPTEITIIDLALGVPAAYPAPRRRARQHFLSHPHGVLGDVTADGVEVVWPGVDDRWPAFTPRAAADDPHTHAVIVGRLPGDVLGDQIDSGHRSASVIVDAPLDADIEHATKTAAGRVTLTVRPA
ncbi:biotin carboxylase [Actinoplanes sp. SE50]|uniref:ATP-grasp domain-containing protein n=1 Tax=unclassified Actinoplanes TaxID=2626549 RepID=UPI00023EE015|nr:MULTISPECIES: ATP-grasp domain-containing protein [unclassified Actinoplanes]AEV88375.1 Biotin carboxylase [Actinoplanes sp. SE50/110]ATO86780.1 biotin carboxylase [Actinoplanes sp. SE50]SLM04198.1 biotin carboxylase [Actinoplanes sp. SE50/110]